MSTLSLWTRRDPFAEFDALVRTAFRPVKLAPAGFVPASEISRDGDVTRTHSRVRPRHVPSGTRYAAVYPGLPAGRYTVWRDREHPAATPAAVTVTVTGGEITTCHWPG